MGTAVVTMKIMPESPDTNLDKITEQVAKMVREFAGERDTKVTIEPIAFGLKCINFIFVMDEKLGSPDVLADKIMGIDGVQNAEVSDVRRAIG
jgi:elongation factor 1-beta